MGLGLLLAMLLSPSMMMKKHVFETFSKSGKMSLLREKITSPENHENWERFEKRPPFSSLNGVLILRRCFFSILWGRRKTFVLVRSRVRSLSALPLPKEREQVAWCQTGHCSSGRRSKAGHSLQTVVGLAKSPWPCSHDPVNSGLMVSAAVVMVYR